MLEYNINKKNKTEKITIRLTKEDKEYLKKYCSDRNLTLTEYISKLIHIDITRSQRHNH